MLESDKFDIVAPMAALDIEDWLDLTSGCGGGCDSPDSSSKPGRLTKQDSAEQSDLFNSLEDLVKTFDQNVKKCLSNYKDVDVGQLAPVQVRAPEDIINDSPIWYTLTGNFGNLLPIDYWSKSLLRKYHHRSLNVKPRSKSARDDYDDLIDSDQSDLSDEDYDELNDGELFSYNNKKARRSSMDDGKHGGKSEEAEEVEEDFLAFDEEEDELREQLDMHSMILSKNEFNQSALEEPLLTAEQVLNEIDTMMMMQEEYYDEMTPDSGCFSVINSASFSNSNLNDLSLDLNASYLKYIGTFAEQDSQVTSQVNGTVLPATGVAQAPANPFKLDRPELDKLNIYELNELVEQIELYTTELSDTLVQELALRDELEFEKETRNTFISLIMSIQEKRRMLNMDMHSPSGDTGLSILNRHSASFNLINSKKKNRRSLINFSMDSSNPPTHLTTIIPYNSEIEYTVQHLSILNKLLKAINEDSHQVPELLTNYILKVVCPT